MCISHKTSSSVTFHQKLLVEIFRFEIKTATLPVEIVETWRVEIY